MRWPKFNVYDFFFLLTYAILNFYLVHNNQRCVNCQHPVYLWLALHYTLLFLIRILFVIKHSGYKEIVIQIVDVLLYAFVLPGLVTWCVLGTIWIQVDYDEIPKNMVPWSFVLWLGIGYLAGIAMIVSLVYDLFQYRRLNSYIQKMDNGASLANVSDYDDNSKYMKM